MSLIQVADLRLEADRRKQLPSTNPEQQLLLEAQLRATAVQLAGNAAVRGVIRRVIAVQQVKLHSTDLYLPNA
jgi:hypothetical protein